MAAKLRWGIVGTGMIARKFANALKASQTGSLLAVGSRVQGTADAFGAELGVPRCYGTYDALLADPDVQVVYVATPHPMHAEWAIKAAEAGKHVLVEKPIGLNWHETMAIVEAARDNDVFLMEAFMYRCHPQTARLVELVKSKAVGELGLIQATFSFKHGHGPEKRWLSQDLGGGGILDVGCYTTSMARLIAGAAAGKDFDEPLEVKGCGHLGATGVDYWAAASLKFPGGIVAQLCAGIMLRQENVVRLIGSEGTIVVPSPWFGPYPEPATILVQRTGEKQPQEVIVQTDKPMYAYEADEVAAGIARRQSGAMSWADSLGNMKVLDRWRQEIGLVYEREKPAGMVHTITHRPLEVRKGVMKYGRIAGLDKPVSRLVMGCDSNNTMPDTAVMFDDWFERGGNTFDTSHGYGNPNGACERNLGQWIRNRGIRDKVVVNEKGANYPRNTPDGLSAELIKGLERLQMEWVDIFMIHRDNVLVPVGEWVDVLNEHLRAGRMKVFGLSNFSVARLKAFGEYAARHGLRSFSAVSNQFSLARVLAPLWDMELESSSDAESRAWFQQTQTPLMSWSSQARGFFTERASRENRSDPEFNRCWYSDDNFKRKERAEELARKRGVLPINVALAYVLCQPFPTFPLIGPKQIAESRSSLAALEVELSPRDLRWLNLEE